MSELQLNLTMLLPAIDTDDQCTQLLIERLSGVRGVELAHIVRKNGSAELCLHYDPNLVPLPRLERLAVEAGAQINDSYRHETLPFVGLDAADNANSLSQALELMPGMLHANVSYAAGLIYVAYDSTQLNRSAIEQLVNRWGARILPFPQSQAQERAASVTPSPDSLSVHTGEEHASIERELVDDDHAALAHADHEHDDHDHAGHSHGSAPTFLPHWMQERWTLILVVLAGLFLAIAWIGESYLGMQPAVALIFYLL